MSGDFSIDLGDREENDRTQVEPEKDRIVLNDRPFYIKFG